MRRGAERVVPYLARKSTEEPSDVLQQGVDGLTGERTSERNGLDGPDGESQIRGGEKPRRGVRRRASAGSGEDDRSSGGCEPSGEDGVG